MYHNKSKGTTINHLGSVVQIEKKNHSEACRKKRAESRVYTSYYCYQIYGDNPTESVQKNFIRENPHHAPQMINGRPLRESLQSMF